MANATINCKTLQRYTKPKRLANNINALLVNYLRTKPNGLEEDEIEDLQILSLWLSDLEQEETAEG